MTGRLHTCYSPVRRSPAGRASSTPAAPRLACVKPAASVHPEPGSNSPLLSISCSIFFLAFLVCLFRTYVRSGRLRISIDGTLSCPFGFRLPSKGRRCLSILSHRFQCSLALRGFQPEGRPPFCECKVTAVFSRHQIFRQQLTKIFVQQRAKRCKPEKSINVKISFEIFRRKSGPKSQQPPGRDSAGNGKRFGRDPATARKAHLATKQPLIDGNYRRSGSACYGNARS